MNRRVNLHNHTTFSDGALRPEVVVKLGADFGFSDFGIADHYQTQKLNGGGVAPWRVPVYVNTLRDAAQKYKDRMKLWVGLEIDFMPGRSPMEDLFQPTFKEGPASGIDFMLFEYVDAKRRGEGTIGQLLELREKIPVPVGLAHTDLGRKFGRTGWDPFDLAQRLCDKKIFVELCPSRRNSRLVPLNPALSSSDRPFGDLDEKEYVPYYRVEDPFVTEFFVEFAQMGGCVSVGTDAHEDLEDFADVYDALEFMESFEARHGSPLRLFTDVLDS